MHLPLVATVALQLSCASAQSLGQALASHGSLSTLHGLLVDLDLLSGFEAAQNATLLAMTDEAIIGLANWGLNMSLIDAEIARGILKYHFLEGLYTSADPSLRADTQLVPSVLRPPVLTNVTDGPVVKLSAGGVSNSIRVESGLQKVLQTVDADIYYDSGVVHAIDSNLVLPHNISETTNIGKLLEFWGIIEKSQTRELLETLRDATIFLPNDKAVRKGRPVLDSLEPEQLAAVVLNHAIPNRVLHHTAFAGEEKEFTTLSGMKVRVRRDLKGHIRVNDAGCGPSNGILREYMASPRRLYTSHWRAVAQVLPGAAAAVAVCILATSKIQTLRAAKKERVTAFSTTHVGNDIGEPQAESEVANLGSLGGGCMK
ncbi:MFP1 protein [Fusarium austroafricanum]|uniref:MFP1 protein n=1 Tax=Fusarium austroafricanum TaxID=2364996 RepID=A0A8H4JX14_9HYPO|nr:MFP1 protein [Fusarium austroafricanum]